MFRTILVVGSLIAVLLLACEEDKLSKKPEKLTDEELCTIIEQTEDRDISPYWLEAEKRQLIYIRFISQDKSGTILNLSIDERFSEKSVKNYILFKLKDPAKLSYAEKGMLFYQAASYQLQEAVPLIVSALEGEASLNPHIAAAFAFGRLKAVATRSWLEKNLNEEYRKTLGTGSPFDESKRDELLKASKEALEAMKD